MIFFFLTIDKEMPIKKKWTRRWWKYWNR